MRTTRKAARDIENFNLPASEARYRAIVDTAVDAIVVIDEHGGVCAFNPAAERLFGYEAVEMMGRNVRELMDQPHHEAHDGYLQRYRDTGERKIIGIGRAVSGRRKDGSTFPLELSVAEWRAGEERFFTGVMRDVTERTKAEELQRLMVNELNHRVKNTLATVQSVAMQTMRNALSLDTARHALTERLLALAKAHDVLTREHWDGADLADIAFSAIDAHGAAARVQIVGGRVRLQPASAVAMAMALHELFTNAAKYGALTTESGRIEIDWTQDEGRCLRLSWREVGGPPITPPSRRGFGFRMIDGVARDLEGHAELTFEADGLHCVITAAPPMGTREGQLEQKAT